MTDSSLRASDAERDAAVESLRQHLVDGRLSLEEFTDRVGSALAARTHGQLAEVAADLPSSGAVVTAGPDRRAVGTTAAIFGHAVRRGRFRLRRRTRVVAAFADVDLDLRDASLEAPETTVAGLLLFGNVDVYVPEGVNVEVNGLTLFGHRRQWGRDGGSPDAPTIRIRVIGIFATADVWCVPRDLQGDYGQIIRELEGKDGPRALPQ